jgi:hypothetical protein
MKGGGADVRVLNREPVNLDGEDWRGDIVRCARVAAGYATDDRPLAGFVVLALFSDGATSVGWRYDPDTAKIPRALLPHWVSEVIRRDLIVSAEAQDTFNNMFEWCE